MACAELEARLRDRIRRGAWPIGTLLPPLRDLSVEFGVSYYTVQNAVKDLVAQGILKTKSRQGTVVAGLPSDAVHLTARASEALLGIVAALDSSERTTDGIMQWANQVVHAAEQVAAEYGSHTHLYEARLPGQEDRPTPAAAIEQALADGVDALAIINADAFPGWETAAADLVDASLPVVYAASLADLPVPHVACNQEYTGAQAVGHLAVTGYSRIAVLTPYKAPWLTRRICGAQESLSRHGLKAADFRVIPAKPQTDFFAYRSQSRQERRKILRRVLRPAWKWLQRDGTGAIVAANDLLAFDVLELLQGRQITPGSDIGLIGFDDHFQSRSIGLTSIRPPLEQMGRTAARLLLRALAGEPMPLKVQLQATVVARLSTRRHQ